MLKSKNVMIYMFFTAGENPDTLILKKLTEADMGNYICEVTDSDGKNTRKC